MQCYPREVDTGRQTDWLLSLEKEENVKNNYLEGHEVELKMQSTIS